MMSYSEKKYGRKIIGNSPTYTSKNVKSVNLKKSVLTIICILFLIIGFIIGNLINSIIINDNQQCVDTLKGGE